MSREPQFNAGRERLRVALTRAFGDLPAQDLVALAALFEEKAISRGTRLCTEGDAAEHVFVLLAGRLRVRVGSYDTTRVIGEIGPGETVGEVGAVRAVRARRRWTP